MLCFIALYLFYFVSNTQVVQWAAWLFPHIVAKAVEIGLVEQAEAGTDARTENCSGCLGLAASAAAGQGCIVWSIFLSRLKLPHIHTMCVPLHPRSRWFSSACCRWGRSRLPLAAPPPPRRRPGRGAGGGRSAATIERHRSLDSGGLRARV
jgi:hypothetical protein